MLRPNSFFRSAGLFSLDSRALAKILRLDEGVPRRLRAGGMVEPRLLDYLRVLGDSQRLIGSIEIIVWDYADFGWLGISPLLS